MTEVQKLKDDGTEMVPIYTVEQLVYRVKNGLPITKKEVDDYNIKRLNGASMQNFKRCKIWI
ncbi:hypothetical protein [Staphylococcus felis]|uniref:Uncharacterized protein n=1 Tax=Staphylococcus felis TaxID=46127 RepID=A0ABS0QRK8_9STAP|nr:hypothetical protein [Staphylococcus felis]MBH9581749.1 hypothetical protein [Staphylococcus felis]